ncbi:hypothetical protein EVAR_17045_1 [Eumeta japonica]|uniref:Uncharacterized protein n=1 Tax=Eumeta variegata TaxID=151549 RepID=A0A4C1V4I6_EUMVA|nr:hypothetical protein EVAR_17045_1 [Eumeta japonica]
MRDRQNDILCLNEANNKGGSGAIRHEQFNVYYSGVDQSQRRWRSVGFILSERMSECVNRHECVNPSLLFLRVNTELMRIFILGAYVLDTRGTEEGIEARKLWADVQDTVVKRDKNVEIVILDNFNGCIVLRRE